MSARRPHVRMTWPQAGRHGRASGRQRDGFAVDLGGVGFEVFVAGVDVPIPEMLDLPVADGDAVVPVINRLCELFAHVVLTQDWHPSGHSSFATSRPGAVPFESVAMPYGQQTLWPDHCVQGTLGAAFHPQLATARAELVIRKGFRPGIDSYSAFYENDRRTPTGLAGYLRERGLQRIFLTGLATDYCVKFTALDARALGFSTVLLDDACRGVELQAGDVAKAVDQMIAAGVKRFETAVPSRP